MLNIHRFRLDDGLSCLNFRKNTQRVTFVPGIMHAHIRLRLAARMKCARHDNRHRL